MCLIYGRINARAANLFCEAYYVNGDLIGVMDYNQIWLTFNVKHSNLIFIRIKFHKEKATLCSLLLQAYIRSYCQMHCQYSKTKQDDSSCIWWWRKAIRRVRWWWRKAIREIRRWWWWRKTIRSISWN